MVERSQPDGHGNNVVNVILVDFRGLDTLGEITVLATASIGMVALARAGRRAPRSERRRGGRGRRETPRGARRVGAAALPRRADHVGVPAARRHNQPGGGFVGGLLVGAAIAMRYAAGGIDEVRAISWFTPWTILGAGLLLAAVTATVPLLLGDSVLEGAIAHVDLPVLGEVT